MECDTETSTGSAEERPRGNPAAHLSAELQKDLFEYCQRLGDDRLIAGHRLSEWCGHGPILEEDIALANIALDLIGQAAGFLGLAGRIENKGRDEDALAYLRETVQFRCCHLVEQPRGDFAFTIARQFLFSLYAVASLTQLSKSALPELAALAAKSLKEAKYHLRHCAEWVIRLGDGTEESRSRIVDAFENIWRFNGELYSDDEVDKRLAAAGLVPLSSSLKAGCDKELAGVFQEATLTVPDSNRYMVTGGRAGRHSEHLGHLLAEMQILPRSFPGAKW